MQIRHVNQFQLIPKQMLKLCNWHAEKCEATYGESLEISTSKVSFFSFNATRQAQIARVNSANAIIDLYRFNCAETDVDWLRHFAVIFCNEICCWIRKEILLSFVDFSHRVWTLQISIGHSNKPQKLSFGKKFKSFPRNDKF